MSVYISSIPKFIEPVDEVRTAAVAARHAGKRVGFVPTMGALHAGHRSLIETARRECDFVVVSIFVNPTQFGPHEDFRVYPRDLDADLAICRESHVDVVFHPRTEIVYPAGFATFVEVGSLSDILEGRYRPGHFRGVTTVVLKLFNIVPADVAYFGQKDYQQQTIIRRMCRELNLPIEIRVCPTVREPDGLALSSRNVFLSSGERQSALSLSRSLELARDAIQRGERDLKLVRSRMLERLNAGSAVEAGSMVVPDYATIVDPETMEEVQDWCPRLVALVAARVGTTRLIDNLIIES